MLLLFYQENVLNCNILHCIIVHFKRSGSRYIHKNIKLQKSMEGMNRILCKTNLTLIWRHIYKCNTFSNVNFEAFSKSAYVLCGIHNFNKRVFPF